MNVDLKKEQNLELLLENLIRVQAKLIEKVEILNKRLNQIEQSLQRQYTMIFSCVQRIKSQQM